MCSITYWLQALQLTNYIVGGFCGLFTRRTGGVSRLPRGRPWGLKHDEPKLKSTGGKSYWESKKQEIMFLRGTRSMADWEGIFSVRTRYGTGSRKWKRDKVQTPTVVSSLALALVEYGYRTVNSQHVSSRHTHHTLTHTLALAFSFAFLLVLGHSEQRGGWWTVARRNPSRSRSSSTCCAATNSFPSPHPAILQHGRYFLLHPRFWYDATVRH